MNSNSNPMDTNWNNAPGTGNDYQTANSSGFDKYGRPIKPPPAAPVDELSHLPADPSWGQGNKGPQPNFQDPLAAYQSSTAGGGG